MMGPNSTVEEAREWVRSEAGSGVRCPCCDRLAKVYKRKLNSSMAFVAILLFRHGPKGEFFHVPSFLNELGLPGRVSASIRGDWAKLCHWGLLEKKPGKADMGGAPSSGYYKITDKLRLFVSGFLKLPSYVLLFNGVPQAFSPDLITLKTALRNKFDYDELMKPTKGTP